MHQSTQLYVIRFSIIFPETSACLFFAVPQMWESYIAPDD